MAGSFISFTDGSGAAQLDNGTTAIAGGVGSRFANWTSLSTPFGPSKAALGTGQRFMFQFRVDYTAAFELHDIPNANVTILDRLIAHLIGGGTVSVTTGDTGGNVYSNCCLAEGSTPKKTMSNRNDITWSLSLTLLNLSAAPMTCSYSS